MYMQDQKIGYSRYASAPSHWAKRVATRNDSLTVMDLGLMGTSMKLSIDSVTWTAPDGSPLQMEFKMMSGGRAQKMTATFGAHLAKLRIENGGAVSFKSLTFPKGAQIVDDPLTIVLTGKMKPGSTKSFYVLDPTTATFLKNEVKLVGPSSVTVNGKKRHATLVEITDPRAVTHIYMSAKGDLIQANGPMGIEMRPESKIMAMSKASPYSPRVDLALATKITTTPPIGNPGSLNRLSLRVDGPSLITAPSDTFQTITQDDNHWIVAVHPVSLRETKGLSRLGIAGLQEEWLKPSLNIPSDSVRFKKLAAEITNSRNDVRGAAFAIRQYVYETMRPNAGIGVLRDASEVLDTREGVCRDYAILAATLMRSAGIPCRLASGLVNWDGDFFYHAWVEVFDGNQWIGVDSTTDRDQIGANHIKLRDGNVNQAFTFTFLDKAKFTVLSQRSDTITKD